MKFPNAAVGIAKIFKAEILSLIAFIATGAASIFGVAFSVSEKANNTAGEVISGAGIMVLLIAAAVLSVIALIFKIIGVIQTSRDEYSFKLIIYLTIFSLVLSAISGIFSRNVFLYNLASAVSGVVNLITTLLIILGIGNMAAQLHDNNVIANCSLQFKVILGIGIFSLLARFFSIFMANGLAMAVVIILGCIYVILGVVQYILYITLLSQAKTMLAKDQ